MYVTVTVNMESDTVPDPEAIHALFKNGGDDADYTVTQITVFVQPVMLNPPEPIIPGA
jgi:hypothetical protein